jgi:hypothetical protein
MSSRVLSLGDNSAPAEDPSDPIADFHVYQHDIRYAYSCYLSTNIDNFEKVGKNLLESGFALLVSLPNGYCAWRIGGRTVFGDLEEADTIGAQSTKFRLPKTLDPALKGQIGKTALLRSAERSIFGNNSFPEAYIRVFLPPIRIVLDDAEIVDLDLQVKLFASGIVLLSFGLSERCDMGLKAYIKRRVNLGHHPLSAIELRPEMAHLMMDAVAGEGVPFYARWKILRLRKAVRSKYPPEMREDGTHFVRLTGSDTSQLNGFALELVQALAYCLGRPRSGLSYLIRGEPHEPRWTGFWSASPHVHLLHFSQQQTSAALNEQLHHDALVRVLARTTAGQLVGASLPENLRKFDDVGIYANESILLWVYAALTEEPVMDGTLEHPLFSPTMQHEVKGEVIEFAPMLYRSFIHELENRNLTWGRVLSARERIVEFELTLADVGKFGEVRESIVKGLEARDLSKIRHLAERQLALRESTASVEESRRLTAVGVVLAVTIGALGLPGVIEFVSEQAFPALGWTSLRPSESLLIAGMVSGVAFASTILVALYVVRHRKWIRWRSGRKRS